MSGFLYLIITLAVVFTFIIVNGKAKDNAKRGWDYNLYIIIQGVVSFAGILIILISCVIGHKSLYIIIPFGVIYMMLPVFVYRISKEADRERIRENAMLNRLQTIRNQKNKENDDEDKLFEADEKMFDNTEINENKSDDLDKQIADVKKIKETYLPGMRIRLLKMDDVQAPPPGTIGEVLGVDDTGSLLMRWSNGSGLNVVYGEDIVRKV